MWSVVEAGGGGAGGGGGGDGAAVGPEARAKHAAAVAGDRLLVLGGRGAGGSKPLRDFWQYSLAEGSWRRLGGRGVPPGALQEHSALAHGGRLYVFGGEAAPSHHTPLWVYDMHTEVWRHLTGAPAPAGGRARGRRAPAKGASPLGRRGHSAHALADCMLIYGGYMDLRGSTNELWAFHFESEAWRLVRALGAPPAPARHRHAAALCGGRLYVHGGHSDLRQCGDLWHYDTMSRVWACVRTPPKLSPRPRSGHAGLGCAPFLYVYGGDVAGQPCNELWRFHTGAETWQRTEQGLQWPSPRADCCALLLGGAPTGVREARAGGAGAGAGGAGAGAGGAGAGGRAPRPTSLLRELSRLGARRGRGDYRALAGGAGESSESLVPPLPLPKSRSAHAVAVAAARAPPAPLRPPARERISVPDFADMVLPTPVLSPVEAARLVYFDSDEEEELRRHLPQARPHLATPERGEPTSDYASAERVAGSGANSAGFSNPHYLWAGALTPDSGLGLGGGAHDIELLELGGGGEAQEPPAPPPPARYLLVLGGRETHPARQQAPLSMWACRLP